MHLKPTQTLAIVSVFLAVGIAAAWFTTAGFKSQGPGDLGVDPSGNLYAHFQGKVFVYRPDGGLHATHDLQQIGADSLWGGIAFMEDGSWLIAPERGGQPGRLQRCDTVPVLSCQPLPLLGRDFFRTFRLATDARDRIYLSDSARHSLTLHEADGQELASAPLDLRHPGEVKRYGDVLALADVDRLRMRVLPLDRESGHWQEPGITFTTPGQGAADALINQPVDFLQHDDMWYVLVKDVTMAYARLHRYTQDGDFIDQLPLPDNGMIMAIERLGDHLVLSDFHRKRLLRIGLDGTPMEDLGGPEWRSYAEELEQGLGLKRAIGYTLWALFAGLLLMGLVIGYRLEKGEQAKSAATVEPIPAETPEPMGSDSAIIWLGMEKQLKWAFWLIAGSLLGIAAMTVPLVGEGCAGESLRLVLGIALVFLVLLMAPLFLLLRRVSSTQLGIKDEWLLVRFADGTLAKGRAPDLLLIRNSFVIVGGRKVMLGAPGKRLYDRTGCKTHLEPLLQQAKPLRGLAALRWRWRHDRTALGVEGVATVFALALLWVMLTGGEQKFEAWLGERVEACEQRDGEESQDTSVG